ncbi:unnamed protein product [Allacma fusca]|uniref:Uncharacterized protein n=1 Tax=Allacma fusca TaxID=39272 RepID=A0A8J2JL60_9HEXA|nr:unnamed protein product [Allacma fusca]
MLVEMRRYSNRHVNRLAAAEVNSVLNLNLDSAPKCEIFNKVNSAEYNFADILPNIECTDRLTPSEEHWDVFTLKKIFGKYGTELEARQKEKLAVETSDVNTDCGLKRKRKQSKIFDPTDLSGPKKGPKFRRIPDAPIYSEESDVSEESDSSLTIPKLISPKCNGTSKSSRRNFLDIGKILVTTANQVISLLQQFSSSVYVPKKSKMLQQLNLTSLERVDSSTIQESVSEKPQTFPR